jgi:hypothetical protein
MPGRVLSRLTYANVVASVALVLAMGGGAYAAINSVPGPGGVIHGCYARRTGSLRLVGVARKCARSEYAISFNQKGRTGQAGARGLPGAPGTPGAPGAPGAPGPVTGTLPRGITLRGTYTVRDRATAANDDLSVPISWGFSLATAPATHFVSQGSPAPSGCAGGTAAAPAADPGNVCIYAASGTNDSVLVFDTVSANVNTSQPYGTGLLITAIAAGEFGSFGSWAVTGS